MPHREKKTTATPSSTADSSYSFRPSSPIHSTPSTPSRSFFSRSLTHSPRHHQQTSRFSPPEPSPRIPWEGRSITPPPPSSSLFSARPSSPLSTISCGSATSGSNKSRGGGLEFGGLDQVTMGDERPWGFDEDESSVNEHGLLYHSRSDLFESTTKKGSPTRERTAEKVRKVFGIQKKGSNFSLKGIAKSVVSSSSLNYHHHVYCASSSTTSGRDASFEHGRMSPPDSPTSLFPSAMIRQHSSPPQRSSSPSRPELPRSIPSSPMLPLPFPARERTLSSPAYVNEFGGKGSVKGKAAKFLGEDIVPHGKAARLLGLERKTTLHPKASNASLNESTRSYDRREQSESSEGLSFFEPFDSPPTSQVALPSLTSPSSPSKSPRLPYPAPSLSSRHRHNESASDPFWHTADPPVTSPGLSSERLPVVVESPVSPRPPGELPTPPRSLRNYPLDDDFDPEDSDPVDSVYMGPSRGHSSLNSFSIDLRHLSALSTSTNMFPGYRRDDSISPASTHVDSAKVSPTDVYRFPSIPSSSTRISLRSDESSIDDLSTSSRLPSPSHSRFSRQPSPSNSRFSSDSPINSRRASPSLPPSRLSTMSSLRRKSFTDALLPPPLSALPPLPPSTANSSTSRIEVLLPSSSTASTSFVSSAAPPPSQVPPPERPLPEIPTSSHTTSTPPLFPTTTNIPNVVQVDVSTTPPIPLPPKRSNTLLSIASTGTRQRQYSNTLELLEGKGRHRQIKGGMMRDDEVREGRGGKESTMREAGRKRAAEVRKVNRRLLRQREEEEKRQVEGKTSGEVGKDGEEEGPLGRGKMERNQVEERKISRSFLDFGGSDGSDSGDERGIDSEKRAGSVEREVEGNDVIGRPGREADRRIDVPQDERQRIGTQRVFEDDDSLVNLSPPTTPAKDRSASDQMSRLDSPTSMPSCVSPSSHPSRGEPFGERTNCDKNIIDPSRLPLCPLPLSPPSTSHPHHARSESGVSMRSFDSTSSSLFPMSVNVDDFPQPPPSFFLMGQAPLSPVTMDL